MNFWNALTILFIGLKLAEVINWSWYLVLLPAFMPFVILISIFLVVLICTSINKLRK